eukprot:GHRQ01022031.1.p1 GENE.GHRQ01022031.1~~GHRQ01022031.1.p1  ORF type:complete len:180 (+),score=67.43 GHRQ01022031.1:225-764(+)
MGSNTDTRAFERWNTHFSTVVEQEVLGVNLRLAQDPSSEHLGTTVWDASIVLAKYLEKNMRKGEFSRPKASGKRAIELGAGMGLAGLAFALIGANVLLTDVAEVMPLLQRNYDNNLSAAALRGEAGRRQQQQPPCVSLCSVAADAGSPSQTKHAPVWPPAFCVAHKHTALELIHICSSS